MTNSVDSKWWVLFTACLLTVMLNFDATAVNIAIPVMSDDLHGNLADMQWVINAFVLTSAMFQIIGGRMGDMYGPRRVYIVGTLIFVASSLIAGVAMSEEMLIASRVGQGFALGIAYPMTLVLILNAFPEEQQAMAMGFVMGTMGVSLAIGPTLGGIILHYVGWRWIFLINLPVGVLTVICTFIFCRPDQLPKTRQQLDYVGGVFLVLGLLGIILALNQSQNWGVDSLLFVSVFLAGVLSIIVLYFVEQHRDNRLVDFNLFKRSHFSVNSLIRVVSQVVFLPVLFFTPIYLQNILGYDAVDAGLILLVCTLIIGVLSPFAGRLVDLFGDRMPTIVSMLFYTIGSFLFYKLTPMPNPFLLYGGLIAIGFATGINFVSTTAGALKGIVKEEEGLASGLFFTIIWGSCALGIAIFGLILSVVSKAHLKNAIATLPFSMTAEQLAALARTAKGLSPVEYLAHYFPQEHIAALNYVADASFMAGFNQGFLLLTVLSAMGLVCGFVLRK